MTTGALDTFLDEIGALEDPDLEHDVHRCAVGDVRLVLRRDCHGALRRLEAEFPEAGRDALRARLAPIVGSWLTVVPGRFDLADVPRLGRLSLLAGRLDVAVRLSPERALLGDLLSRITSR